jgi:hypothetical protein
MCGSHTTVRIGTLRRMGKRGIVGVATMAALLAAPGTALADPHIPAEELLQAVNAKRAAVGVPALVLDEKMTQGCREWTDYVLQNEDAEFHDETPGRPGYTELGRRAAQRANGGWNFRDPFSPVYTAPKHRYGSWNPIPIKVGIAERREGTKVWGCEWTSLYEDADLQPARRAPANPRGYAVPGDGAKDVFLFEIASEAPTTPAQDLGFTGGDPRYAAGFHVFLYHDDLPGTALEASCRAVLLGPGGRPVDAPLFDHRMLVPRTPYLPGAAYRAVATHSPTAACGAVQRTSSSQFTTEQRKPDDGLIRIGEPYERDGRWRADSWVDPYLRTGTGTIALDWDNVHGKYTWDLKDWWAGGRPPEDLTDYRERSGNGKVTLRIRNDLRRIGATCWSPIEVTRTFTLADSGVTAGPQQTTRTSPDPCTTPPSPAAPVPASGAPGTVVRIAGAPVSEVAGVQVGGVDATAWEPDGADAIRVTVPSGARTGPLTVRTASGTGTATASFGVPATDQAAPDTWIDLGPNAGGEPSTAQVAFSSTEGGGGYRCALDGEPPAPCTSPWVREGLPAGSHTLRVTAVDAAGNADPTPALTTWRVGAGTPVEVPGAPGTTGGGSTGGGSTGGGSTGGRPGAASAATTLKLTGARIRRKTGRLTLGTVKTARRARVRVTVTARLGGRTRTLARVQRELRAGGSAALSATLSRAHRRALGRAKRLKLTVVTTTRPLPSGATTTTRRTVTAKIAA